MTSLLRRCAGPALLMLLVAMGGCDRSSARAGGTGAGGGDGAGASDGAGAQGAEGIWTDRAAWTLEEEVRIGSVDGDPMEAFGQVVGLALDDDLNVYVLDGQAREVRVFDREGRYVRTIGGPGAGPGEFRRPYAIAIDEEGTLWVADSGNGRYMSFDRAGSPALAVARPSHGAQARGQLRVRGGRIHDLGGLQRREEADGAVRVESVGLALVTVALDAERALENDTLLFDAHPTEGFTFESNGTRTTMVPPFAARQVFDAGPGGRVWTGVGDRYEIEGKSSDGEPVRLARRVGRTALSPEDTGRLRQWADQMLAGGVVGEDSLLPTHYPFFERIVASEDGTVWVYREGPGGQGWFDVFEPTGSFLGEIPTELAAGGFGAHPTIRETHLAGVKVDDLGVQYVSVQRIHRPDPERP